MKTALTSKQQQFVLNFISTGGNATESAKLAGYSEKTASVQGSQLLKLSHVQQELIRLTGQQFSISAVQALGKIIHLSDSAKSEYVQLEASKDILDRAGFKPPDKAINVHAGDVKITIDLD
ncbi:terminase small subunit [uncultured Mediterranean phage uvMED]|nr:terminase small subunit [uncultured Mediterranean phage uvMED]BAR16567.1 terminase small subunit [uncultured Mediterranean phage uvMED]